MAWGLRVSRGKRAERWAPRTLAQEMSRIDSPRLRALLGARWADHGAPLTQAPMVEHALVTGACNTGSCCPIGGPSRFAQTLRPVIEAAGGEIWLGADVKRLVTSYSHVDGVEFEVRSTRRREHAQHLISSMGLSDTVAGLDAEVAPTWQKQVLALEPGISFVSLFVGLDGDINSAGAGTANYWIYESEDIGALWRWPAVIDAPALFVSFPSLKDPEERGQPTSEVVAVVDPQAFAPWIARLDAARSEDSTWPSIHGSSSVC